MSNPVNVTADLFRRLRHGHERDGVVVLCEVGDGAGFRNSGRTDAIAMQTWPSKKLCITGYELKATRQDWLRELNNAGKNAVWQAQCHEWYIVAPKGIVNLTELPSNWGLMVPSGKHGLRIASRATDSRRVSTVPLDLLAAVFRAASKERDRMGNAARHEIRVEVRQSVTEEMTRIAAAAKKWEGQYRELADALGSRWDGLERLKEMAVAVRMLKKGDEDPRCLVRELRKRFEHTAGQLAQVEKRLDGKRRGAVAAR